MDHEVLLAILKEKIKDKHTLKLLAGIINSFGSQGHAGKGLPIGNLTSQLFANIYMNEFDQFMKHKLKIKHYVRYTDDFVIVHESKPYLEELLPKIRQFLADDLKLELHPTKISIRKYIAGVDFLGYVVLPYHINLRTKTKRRIIARGNAKNLPSYLGVLSHANSYKIQQELKTKVWRGVKVLE